MGSLLLCTEIVKIFDSESLILGDSHGDNISEITDFFRLAKAVERLLT